MTGGGRAGGGRGHRRDLQRLKVSGEPVSPALHRAGLLAAFWQRQEMVCPLAVGFGLQVMAVRAKRKSVSPGAVVPVRSPTLANAEGDCRFFVNTMRPIGLFSRLWNEVG